MSRHGAFRDAEFRALWIAQILSRAGDQFARVALTVLAFQVTGSALAAGAAYAVTLLPWLIGGPLLGWIGDRYPRRAVLLCCDLASAALIAVMAVPGLALPLLYALLFLATLLDVPFSAARSALVRDVFPDDDGYASATAIGSVTAQFAQVVGFAAGGLVAAATTPGQALLLDAITFLLSAALVRRYVRKRPAARDAHLEKISLLRGVRLVFGDPRLRRLTFYAWLATFLVVPLGVAAPYASDSGGGARTVGLLLASSATGTAVSMIVLSRWVPAERRLRLLEPLAVAAGLPLVLCALHPGPVVSGLLWALSGAGSGYQLAANVAFVRAAPNTDRAQAFGVVSAGLVAGQGIGVVLAGGLATVVPTAVVVAGAGLLSTLCALALWAAQAFSPRTTSPSRPRARSEA
ncbi:MFS transporter [Cryptosporangium japonicum]|uniref:MFS transporter n=1 Tax=Cryptosporangium japonicum TaxID=80872 RepID=A0ABN0UWV3_9ACTN